jgi:hypothetical protein
MISQREVIRATHSYFALARNRKVVPKQSETGHYLPNTTLPPRIIRYGIFRGKPYLLAK